MLKSNRNCKIENGKWKRENGKGKMEERRPLAAQVHFEQFDASKNLPFADNTFDAIFSYDVLCHLPGRPGVLCEMFRILKPGGRMLFSDGAECFPTKKSPRGARLAFTCTARPETWHD